MHRKEKYERAVLGGASVFIFVSEHAGVGPETGSLQNDSPAPIPGISICKEDGAFLLRLAERYGEVRLRVCTTGDMSDHMGEDSGTRLLIRWAK